jgi:hypothetical protein
MWRNLNYGVKKEYQINILLKRSAYFYFIINDNFYRIMFSSNFNIILGNTISLIDAQAPKQGVTSLCITYWM